MSATYIIPVREAAGLLVSHLVNKEFNSKEDAIKYAQSQRFPCTIYVKCAISEVRVDVSDVAGEGSTS